MMVTSDSTSYDQTVELIFHRVEYIIHAFVRNESLIIEAEQKSDGNRWVGEFSAAYIEELCRKTGNSKKFAMFIRMLHTALLHQSETVFIDLLTHQDLELLKQKKTQQQPNNLKPNHNNNNTSTQHNSMNVTQSLDSSFSCHNISTNSSNIDTLNKNINNNKRYLILTYLAEFDKVHYPLPLKFQSNPDPEALKRTIIRLSQELNAVKSAAASTSSFSLPTFNQSSMLTASSSTPHLLSSSHLHKTGNNYFGSPIVQQTPYLSSISISPPPVLVASASSSSIPSDTSKSTTSSMTTSTLPSFSTSEESSKLPHQVLQHIHQLQSDNEQLRQMITSERSTYDQQITLLQQSFEYEQQQHKQYKIKYRKLIQQVECWKLSDDKQKILDYDDNVDIDRENQENIQYNNNINAKQTRQNKLNNDKYMNQSRNKYDLSSDDDNNDGHGYLNEDDLLSDDDHVAEIASQKLKELTRLYNNTINSKSSNKNNTGNKPLVTSNSKPPSISRPQSRSPSPSVYRPTSTTTTTTAQSSKSRLSASQRTQSKSPSPVIHSRSAKSSPSNSRSGSISPIHRPHQRSESYPTFTSSSDNNVISNKNKWTWSSSSSPRKNVSISSMDRGKSPTSRPNVVTTNRSRSVSPIVPRTSATSSTVRSSSPSTSNSRRGRERDPRTSYSTSSSSTSTPVAVSSSSPRRAPSRSPASSGPSTPRSRSQTPSGRFDPTSYNKQKEMKLIELEERKQQNIKQQMTSNSPSSHIRSRSSSPSTHISSLRSSTSSLPKTSSRSCRQLHQLTNNRFHHHDYRSDIERQDDSYSLADDTDDDTQHHHGTIQKQGLASETADITSRLNALQNFLKQQKQQLTSQF